MAFYLQSGIFNDWLYVVLGPLVPPILESCVSVMLEVDLDPKEKKTSKKSKSLHGIVKSVMKIPTALVTIYRAFGNPWKFFLMSAFQIIATIISSQVANEAQSRRLRRETELDDVLTKALAALEAVGKLDVLRTPAASEALGTLKWDVEAALAARRGVTGSGALAAVRELAGRAGISPSSEDALTKAKSRYTASLKLQGVILFSQKLVLSFAFMACGLGGVDQVTLTSLSHRMLALDDICDKIAENMPNTGRIFRLMAEGASPWSSNGFRTIHANFIKACQATWKARVMPLGEVPGFKEHIGRFEDRLCLPLWPTEAEDRSQNGSQH
ncbi:Uu.00g120040.m01.CDS01 [Anthostomella pinea]|uniref:Uu.00g120040.m01.CDS01 n=1 Tax=Anthostomella pinea TaxID=933095 RepID=A0AAI8VGR1_9PEZI|nr:Uu.00g120040.m01.CDS01 [Anthostomella pinea]